jgi:hypothetical protein
VHLAISVEPLIAIPREVLLLKEPRRDYERINMRDRRYNMKTELIQQHIRRKRLTNVSLSSQAKSIILGSILGDGCLRIYKGYKNAKFSIRHSDTQRDYLKWKVNILRLHDVTGTISVSKPDGFSKNVKWIFQSHVTAELTAIHKITHPNNKIEIQRAWLNHLTPLSLAVWWFDDGSLINSGRRGVFCTDSFDLKSCQILKQYLQKVWGIMVKVKPIHRKTLNKSYQRLWICTSELKKLLRIIVPFVPLIWEIFEKKMIIRYKDPILQQRWISELLDQLEKEKKEKTKLIICKLRERYSPILI